MDEQFESKAQDAANDLNKAAEDAWQSLDHAANEAAEQTQAAAEGVVPVVEEAQTQTHPTWQQPQANQPTPQQAPNDPNRWTGELYTPEVTPPVQAYQQPQETYAGPQRVDPPADPKKEKEKFPVWAIILIVLLVLCICVACTIIPLAILGQYIGKVGA